MTVPQLAYQDVFCGFALASILHALSIADIRRGLLPNALPLLLGAFGLLQSMTVGRPALLDALVGSLSCAALLFGLTAAFHRIHGADGLGFGDIKLGGAAGLWLGWEPIPWMLLVAPMLALVFILAGALWRRRLDRLERIAFGPFLSAGVLVSWASGNFF